MRKTYRNHRTGHNDPLLILRALDVGATGVVLPHISTAAEAAAAHYPPFRTQGLAVNTLAGRHSTVPLQAHLEAARANTLVIAQAEDKAVRSKQRRDRRSPRTRRHMDRTQRPLPIPRATRSVLPP
ncbi:hypothetical protein [Arthrobacter sp. ISL-28]|uniref:hypothetical protein n=1 Tax=Arthrobacter sp. ISL-28 TaxID=2819108 RepID=UPI002888FA53|nr:hypothetical protein [Arthrobacter sp. ISL-28]